MYISGAINCSKAIICRVVLETLFTMCPLYVGTPTSVITSSNVDHSTLDAIADLMQTYCSELKERFLEKEKALRKQRKTQDLKSRSTKEFSMVSIYGS